jgi:hypothetical protein
MCGCMSYAINILYPLPAPFNIIGLTTSESCGPPRICSNFHKLSYCKVNIYAHL